MCVNNSICVSNECACPFGYHINGVANSYATTCELGMDIFVMIVVALSLIFMPNTMFTFKSYVQLNFDVTEQIVGC